LEKQKKIWVKGSPSPPFHGRSAELGKGRSEKDDITYATNRKHQNKEQNKKREQPNYTDRKRSFLF
jgi:hypothetical protein